MHREESRKRFSLLCGGHFLGMCRTCLLAKVDGLELILAGAIQKLLVH